MSPLARPRLSEEPRAGEINDATIEACRRGDLEAMELVFRQVVPVVEGVLTRMLGPGVDVDDVIQDTLVTAAGAFKRFRGESSVSTWIVGIAIKTAYRHMRTPFFRRRTAMRPLSSLDGTADPAPATDTVVGARKLLGRLYHHLDQLSDKTRTAFVLHVAEGLSIEDIAAAVETSPATVKTRIFAARQELYRRAKKDPVLRDLVESIEHSREGRA